MKINAKTIAGVGVGLVAGYFLIKNKKPLYIGVMGLAGGVLANLIFNRDTEKKQITASITESANVDDDETSNFELMEDLKEVSTIANVNQTSPKDYFDLDLGFN